MFFFVADLKKQKTMEDHTGTLMSDAKTVAHCCLGFFLHLPFVRIRAGMQRPRDALVI